MQIKVKDIVYSIQYGISFGLAGVAGIGIRILSAER